MSDPNPVVVDPTPDLPPVPAPERLLLAESFPLCFNWERPQPLKIDIHKDLVRAGHDREAVRRALGRYCKADRYRKTLQAGAPRIDLQGQPAGVVTEQEAAHALMALTPRVACATATRTALPPNDTPLPKEPLVPGRLELTVKFSELPQPLPVQDGLKIGVQTGEGIVTAILPPKVWRKLEQAAKDYPQWVAALSGALERFADGEIALKHPALQVFEKKVRPEVAAEGKGPEPNGPAVKAPEPKAPESKAPESKAPDAKASPPKAPDSNGPAVEAPEPKAPEVNASAVKKPEEKASAGKAPDRKTPAAPPPPPTFSKLRLKPRSASEAG